MENLGSPLRVSPDPRLFPSRTFQSTTHALAFQPPEDPPFCSYYLSLHSSLILGVVALILPLSLCTCGSLTWKTNSHPHPLSYILFVSAPTEAWTTQVKVTAPKSHCQCCCHFLHDSSFYSNLVCFIYGHFLPRRQLQHSLCLSLSLLCPGCLEQCLAHGS